MLAKSIWGLTLAMAVSMPVQAQSPAEHSPGPAAGGAPAHGPDQKPVPEPSAALALEAVQVAIATCRGNGYPAVAASVVNSAGELKVMMSADGTPPGHAVAHSAGKALVALAYGVPSAQVQARAQSDAALTAKLAARPDMTPRAGGEPLFSHGKLVGAIGVSGAPGGDKDDVCALAGLTRIRDRL